MNLQELQDRIAASKSGKSENKNQQSTPAKAPIDPIFAKIAASKAKKGQQPAQDSPAYNDVQGRLNDQQDRIAASKAKKGQQPAQDSPAYNDVQGRLNDQQGRLTEEASDPSFMDKVGQYGTGVMLKTALQHMVPEIAPDKAGTLAAATDGLTLGTGDEIGSAIAAGALQGLGRTPDDESFLDTYNIVKQGAESDAREYAETNPQLSLGLNVAGGLGTGGATTIKHAPAIANKMGLTSALSTLGVGTGLATVEGAAVGAASAPQGERLEGAKTGAMWGGLLQGGLGGLSKTVEGITDVVSRRRIKEDLLDESGNFMPLNMADERNFLTRNFQNVVAPSFGGVQLRDQNAKYMDRQFAAQKEKVDALKQDKASLSESVSADAENYNEGLKMARREMDESATGNKTVIEQTADEQIAEATALTERSLNDNQQLMHTLAIREAVPPNTAPEVITELEAMRPLDANAKISEMWGTDAFSVVKSREFAIDDIDKMVDEAVAGLGNDPATRDFIPSIKKQLRSQLGRDFRPKQDPAIQRNNLGMPLNPQPQRFLKEGVIAGDAIMELRNSFRRDAVGAPEKGDGALYGKALNQAAQSIDRRIKRQLEDENPSLLSQYEDELVRYGASRQYQGAVESAAKDQGWFKPNEYLTVGSKYNKSLVGKGKGTLQDEVYEINDIEKDLKRGLNDTIKAINNNRSSEIGALNTATTYAKQDLKIPKKSEQTEALEKQVIAGMDMAEAGKERIKGLKERGVNKNPKQWDQVVASGRLALPFSGLGALFGVVPAVGSTIAGTGAGYLLGTKRAQRVLAGQTAKQQSVADALRNYQQNYKTPFYDMGRGVARSIIQQDVQ